MPPQIDKLSRNFSRNASGLLTMAGHGRRLIVADSSYDLPDRSVANNLVFYYLGNRQGDLSAARALFEIAKAYPIDSDAGVVYMTVDSHLDPNEFTAPRHNLNVIGSMGHTAIGKLKDGLNGFYEHANNSDPVHAPLVCLTGSELSFDCVSVDLDHLQVPNLE